MPSAVTLMILAVCPPRGFSFLCFGKFRAFQGSVGLEVSALCTLAFIDPFSTPACCVPFGSVCGGMPVTYAHRSE